MKVGPLTKDYWPDGDAILRRVYLEEGFIDPGRASNLTVASKAADGIWLGAFSAEQTLLGLVLLTRFGTDAAVVAEPNGCEIRLLAVLLDNRGMGVGRILVVEAERLAIESGAETMTFSTQAIMTTAQRLYLSLGYTRDLVRDYKVEERTFLVFRKILPTTKPNQCDSKPSELDSY